MTAMDDNRWVGRVDDLLPDDGIGTILDLARFLGDRSKTEFILCLLDLCRKADQASLERLRRGHPRIVHAFLVWSGAAGATGGPVSAGALRATLNDQPWQTTGIPTVLGGTCRADPCAYPAMACDGCRRALGTREFWGPVRRGDSEDCVLCQAGKPTWCGNHLVTEAAAYREALRARGVPVPDGPLAPVRPS